MVDRHTEWVNEKNHWQKSNERLRFLIAELAALGRDVVVFRHRKDGVCGVARILFPGVKVSSIGSLHSSSFSADGKLVPQTFTHLLPDHGIWGWHVCGSAQQQQHMG